MLAVVGALGLGGGRYPPDGVAERRIRIRFPTAPPGAVPAEEMDRLVCSEAAKKRLAAERERQRPAEETAPQAGKLLNGQVDAASPPKKKKSDPTSTVRRSERTRSKSVR